MTAKQLFGANLYFLRKKAGLNRAVLGGHFGTSRQVIYSWETGFASPNYDMLVEIADYFDVGIDNLLTVDLKKASL